MSPLRGNDMKTDSALMARGFPEFDVARYHDSGGTVCHTHTVTPCHEHVPYTEGVTRRTTAPGATNAENNP